MALGLASFAVIGLELASMRLLSLRFWHHLAHMVISIALLGFGASGTALTLFRPRILARPRHAMWGTSLGFALAVPAAWWAIQRLPLNVQFMAWHLSGEFLRVAALELVIFTPFLLAGATVGIGLMDTSDRTGGHYAANLIGSGLGALAAVALMHVLTTYQLVVVLGAAAFLAALCLAPWDTRRRAFLTGGVAIAIVALFIIGRGEPNLSQYKMLSMVRDMPGTRVLHTEEGPLGRIDIVEGPAVHYAPGLSLGYTKPVPPHLLVMVDGDQAAAMYRVERPEEWAFLDYTTPALPYHLRRNAEVLIIGTGGGSEVGLARFHHSGHITAVEMNRRLIALLTGPFRDRGGDVFDEKGDVKLVPGEARGFLAVTEGKFDIIQLPPIDGFGASGAGVHAARESYLYTLESFGAMFNRLSERGVLCATRWARTPPREGPRLFNMAAACLRARGLNPDRRLVMIRNWATVTVLLSRSELSPSDLERVKTFCKVRQFDVSYLPGLAESEANRYHVLERPAYFEAAQRLLKRDETYVADTLFRVDVPTDDAPYFHQFLRLRTLPALRRQLGGRMPAFLEMGYVLLIASLVQGAIAAVLFVLLPLAPGLGRLRRVKGKAATFGYFLLLGTGFMLIEMGFMQRLILYLAHPVYSAAMVIACFLVFGGIGSGLSTRWNISPKRLAPIAAFIVSGLGVLYALGLGEWLDLSQGQPMIVRCFIAAVTIAPLAVAMGHLFPTGLRQLGQVAPALIPWAWAVNGSASVVATVGASVLAMSIGFGRVTLLAAAGYGAAGLLCFRLPEKDG